MKKVIILIISIICALNCKAQLTHTSEFIKVNLPDGTYKMNKQQVDALSGKNSTNKFPQQLRLPYTYNVNGILLNVNNVNQDSVNNNLPGTKKFLDNLAGLLKRHGNNTYTSIIKNVKDNQALVTNQIVNGVGRYRFYLQNHIKTLTFIGTIEYPETDSAKARALLDDILNNAQFTTK